MVATRNRTLVRGINAVGKAAMMKKSHKWRFIGKGGKKAVAPVAAVKPVTRYYEADTIPTPLNRRHKATPTKLRSSITPGTVLVLLAGRFRGKRVVFLKQLESGLLLVSGPFGINGVPLRRVNQVYVLSTSTKVDIKKVTIPNTVNDAFFKHDENEWKGTAEDLFATGGKKPELSAERKAAQKSVDAELTKAVSAVPSLKQYLNAKFSLKNGDKPHLMKF